MFEKLKVRLVKALYPYLKDMLHEEYSYDKFVELLKNSDAKDIIASLALGNMRKEHSNE